MADRTTSELDITVPDRMSSNERHASTYPLAARAATTPMRPPSIQRTLPATTNHRVYTSFVTRSFTTTPVSPKKSPLPPRPKVPVEDTTKNYLKGSGPGGQKINKTSSAVQLTHTPTGIVVKCQATRSRTQNESIARRLLAEKVEVLEKGSESRVIKKQQLESRKSRSGEKKRRRKYRALAAEGAAGDGEGDGEVLEEKVVRQDVDVGKEV